MVCFQECLAQSSMKLLGMESMSVLLFFFFFLTCYVICFVLLLHYKSSAFLAFLNTVLDTLTHEKEVPLFASIP